MFCLFCANKAVSVLSKEPHFLAKTTGIFFMPKIVTFFYSRKKRESSLHPKKCSTFFALKKNGNLFLTRIFFYTLRKFRFFCINKTGIFFNTKNRASLFFKKYPGLFQPQKGFPFRLLSTCLVQCVILNQVAVGGRPVRNTSLRTIACYFEKYQNRHKKGK